MPPAQGHAELWVQGTQVFEHSLALGKRLGGFIKRLDINSALFLAPLLGGVAGYYLKISGCTLADNITSGHVGPPDFRASSAISVKLRATTSPF